MKKGSPGLVSNKSGQKYNECKKFIGKIQEVNKLMKTYPPNPKNKKDIQIKTIKYHWYSGKLYKPSDWQKLKSLIKSYNDTI